MKVVLHYLTLLHYRETLFNLLFEDKDILFYIICSKVNPLSNINSFPLNERFRDRVIFVKTVGIGSSGFVYQLGVNRMTFKLRPDVVVLLGVSPAILSSLLSFFLLRSFTKARIFWWGHGTLGQQGRLGRLLRQPFYRMADGVLLYGHAGKATLNNLLGVPNDRLHVIGNCIEEKAYGFKNHNLLSGKRSNRTQLNILFSGRLTEAKNVGLLIETAAILKKSKVAFHLTIIGEGVTRKALAGKINGLEVEKEVTLVGAQYGEDAHKYFLDADIFVLPRAVGLSIIHGLSFGLPVITSDDMSSHKPEIEAMIIGENGAFFRDGDPTSLAEIILQWKDKIDNDRIGVVKKCIESLDKYLPLSVYASLKSVILDV